MGRASAAPTERAGFIAIGIDVGGTATPRACHDVRTSPREITESVENDDESRTVWLRIVDGDAVARLDMVAVPAGSTFQFEGRDYHGDAYSVGSSSTRPGR